MYAMSLRHRATTRLQLEDLSRHLESLRYHFGDAVRPAPEGIWDNRTFIDVKRRLYALSENDFVRFPVELRGVVRGNMLNAYFDCYPFLNSTQSVEARLETDSLPRFVEALRDGRHTPVTEWNLLQLNAAQAFSNLVITPKGGVASPLVETFQMGRPHLFREALDAYAPLRG